MRGEENLNRGVMKERQIWKKKQYILCISVKTGEPKNANLKSGSGNLWMG